MIQPALKTIGKAIIEDEFETKYEPFYTASPIAGENKTIESVVVVRFRRVGSRVEYVDTRVIDPEETPEATARKHGYVYSSGKTDNSISKRATETRPIEDRLSAMLDRWFDENILSDEILSDPLISGISSVSDPLGSGRDAIEQDVDNIAQRVNYRALVTISVIENDDTGEEIERYAGDIDVFNEGMKRWVMDDTRTKSSAKDCYGFAECGVCGAETECFGLGAKMGEQYTVKQQWAFPGYNSSEAWRARPLCIDCITAIDVAADRFLETQSYGPSGIRCRIIPYALPVAGATEQLKALIKEARFTLTPDSDGASGDDGDEVARARPLATAWARYRAHVDAGGEDDLLRLAFSFIVRVSTKTHGVAWIDGMNADQIDMLRTDVEDLLHADPMYEQGLFVHPDPPTERQIFSGRWLFNLLVSQSGSNHRGEYIGDDTLWVEYTKQLLTRGTIRYGELVSALVREARARYRARLGTDTDFPYDSFHIAAAYALLRVAGAHNVLTDDRTNAPMTADIDTLDGMYTTFGAGLEEFINAHPSIAASPGRTAGFVLGAVAAQLDRWQRWRGLSRTVLQNRDIDKLTTATLTRWQMDFWEKAKTYNAQEGNYGVPWSDARELFNAAILAGENDDWKASLDEIRWHFILGTDIGPQISQRAKANRGEEDDETDDVDEPVPTNAEVSTDTDDTETETKSTER
jgi:hypothetical protein